MNGSAGKTALITGASAGIGEALAKQFAKNGFDLILTARREDRLNTLGAALKEKHGISYWVIPEDLADPGGPKRLFDSVQDKGLQTDVLVNNAGFSVQGVYTKTSWKDQCQLIQTMIGAVAELTHHFLPEMTARGYGRIANVASITAFLPSCPGQTLYSASKAFVVEFTETLNVEIKGTGVTATALCPGFIDSEFHKQSGVDEKVKVLPWFWWMDVDRMAELSYRATMAGKPLYVPGIYNKLMTGFVSRLPRRVAVGLVSRVARQVNIQDPAVGV